MKHSVKSKVLNVGGKSSSIVLFSKTALISGKGKYCWVKAFFSYSFSERKSGRLMEHALLNDESE